MFKPQVGYRLITSLLLFELYSGPVKELLPIGKLLKFSAEKNSSFFSHAVFSVLFNKCRAKSFARERHRHKRDTAPHTDKSDSYKDHRQTTDRQLPQASDR